MSDNKTLSAHLNIIVKCKFFFSHWPCTDSAIIIILQTLNQGPVHIVLFSLKICTFLCVLLLCPHLNCLGIQDLREQLGFSYYGTTFEPVDSLPSSFGSCWKLTKSFFRGLPKPKRLNNVCKYDLTEGFLCCEFGGFIIGGAYFQNFTVPSIYMPLRVHFS